MGEGGGEEWGRKKERGGRRGRERRGWIKKGDKGGRRGGESGGKAVWLCFSFHSEKLTSASAYCRLAYTICYLMTSCAFRQYICKELGLERDGRKDRVDPMRIEGTA